MTGEFPIQALAWCAFAPAVLGMMLGRKLRKFINEHRFRHLILVVLLCSGSAILGRGVG